MLCGEGEVLLLVLDHTQVLLELDLVLDGVLLYQLLVGLAVLDRVQVIVDLDLLDMVP